MGLDLSHIKVMSDEMAAFCRSLTFEQKFVIVDCLWRVYRGKTLRAVRRAHPAWNRDQVRVEANRRMLDERWTNSFDEDTIRDEVIHRLKRCQWRPSYIRKRDAHAV